MHDERHINPTDEHQVRLAKVKEMRQQGVEPWPTARPVPNNTYQVMEEFAEHEGKDYTIAGRLLAVRLHGKAAFAELQDVSGRLQLYIKQNDIGPEAFAFFKQCIDIGDIVWVQGRSFKTRTGQITLEVTALVLLSKCLYPLPEKFHGLHDIEVKYRQRYLDLITNPQARERFKKRSYIVRELRHFLDEHDFLEVETPMLHPIAGGAAARPFATHHNTLDSTFYLRIAPELYLKRLVVGGFDRVYEINRNFRNEGISTRHNPEFTMAEFYMAHHDYRYAMGFVEQLLEFVVRKACGATQVSFGEHMISFEAPFARMTIKSAVLVHCGLQESDLQEDCIDMTLERFNVPQRKWGRSLAQKIYALFEEVVEEKLIQPTFVTNFPLEVSPLAKEDPDMPGTAARFELFIAGMEISNGFSELNDPLEQAKRFKQQLAAYEDGDDEAHQYDAEFVHALEYGLPPTAGVGIGIDRLIMVLTDTLSIKEVILFPTLKKKE